MRDLLEFWVEGVPVPKGRARVARTKDGRLVGPYTPQTTRRWEAKVRAVAIAAVTAAAWEPDKAPIELQISVRRAARRGDLDNYVKAVSDALNGVVFLDDRYIVQLVARVEEATAGRPAGVYVTVTRREES